MSSDSFQIYSRDKSVETTGSGNTYHESQLAEFDVANEVRNLGGVWGGGGGGKIGLQLETGFRKG